MIDDRTQEGRLARWFRELDEPPDLRPLKRIDLRLTGFALMALARIPHLAQTSDAVNRQLSCFSSRYMNLLAVFQI